MKELNSSWQQSAFPSPPDWEKERRQAIALIACLTEENRESSSYFNRFNYGKQDSCRFEGLTQIRLIGETLAKLGWQVDIFTPRLQADDPVIVEHNLYCRTIHCLSYEKAFLIQENIQLYISEFIQAFQEFQTLQGTNYPLINTYDFLSGLIGLQLKATKNLQLVHTYNNSVIQTEAQQLIQEEISKQADQTLITINNKEILPSWLIGNQVEIIKHKQKDGGLAKLQRKARNKLGLGKTDKIVLYVGKFAADKGINILASAFSQCIPIFNDLKLFLWEKDNLAYFSQEQQWDLKKLLQQTGIEKHTKLCNSGEAELLYLYYAAADVCVIPSEYEPFSNVVIEAMTYGTPVVASNVGGLKFAVIPEETGILVSPQDSQALAPAIAQILTDKFWAKTEKDTPITSIWVQTGIHLSDLYRKLLAQSLTQKKNDPAICINLK